MHINKAGKLVFKSKTNKKLAKEEMVQILIRLLPEYADLLLKKKKGHKFKKAGRALIGLVIKTQKQNKKHRREKFEY